ncbi:aldose 1-epimerase [Halomonas lysinitropha]|uniref:Aldose 1-epimerase n=1 Tax=Halomonas lysinitropha TaxID=2607506 RepID=A0A5K1I1R2_9GAMM|nr:aldose 1-epimerase [Halomonas lysinitropha]VVZ94331.1 Aldose 1-epimerase [Halomonas lysinitropha]
MSVILRNAALRLEVLPELGGCVVRFDALTPHGAEPLFRPGHASGQDPNGMGLYPLVPWSNRISAGGFTWRGRHYPLPANLAGEPLPIHGDGWQTPWQVESRGEDVLHLCLRSSTQAPFDYRAELIYRLEREWLDVSLAVTHLGEQPAPYGLGLHPWFPRTADVRLEAPAEGVWDVNDRQLPTEWQRLDSGDPWNFSRSCALPSGLIDNLFTGWNGRARLHWPGRGVTLEVTATPGASRFLVFSPGEHADFFCFEPISHDVDAHHFDDPLAHGLVELRQGESLEFSSRFRLLPPDWPVSHEISSTGNVDRS